MPSHPAPPARSRGLANPKGFATALVLGFMIFVLIPEWLPADIESVPPSGKTRAVAAEAPQTPSGPTIAPEANRPAQSRVERRATDFEKPFRTVEGTVAKNHTFSGLLTQAGLRPQTTNTIVTAVRPVFNLNRIKPGAAYTLGLNARNEMIFFDYKISKDQYLRVTRQGKAFTPELRKIEYRIATAVVQGTVRNNLVTAVQKAGGTSRMAMKLAEIFSWDIDFFKDLRKGDRFKIIVEKKYLDGEFATFGKILAVAFNNRKRVFDAIYFEPPDGEGNYYTAEGESLKRPFLKSPLKFSRISSRYTRRRFHPVYKTYLPHLGVDYAAPVGTPVYAISDGIVATAKRNARAGNYIALRHNSIYRTSYSHLSRFAKGIVPGAQVRQGQVIGYVGATGAATGPHLCFHLRKYGKPINPLTFKSPGGPPIAKELRQAFFQVSWREILALEGNEEATDI